MKRYLLYAVLVSILFGCGARRQFNSKIYHEIYSCQGIDIQSLNLHKKQKQDVGIQLDNVTMLIQWDYLSKLGFSRNNDTVFILEMDGVQGDFLFTIWDKSNRLSYTNESGTLMQTKDRIFSKYMMKLVSEWNIDEIKKEEKINKITLPEEIIYATKITFNKGKYHIDCTRFYDFFDLKRDGMD